MYKPKTLKDIIERNAELFGDKIAVQYRHKSREIIKTYSQLKTDIMSLSIYTKEMRVGILGENSYDWVMVFCAVIVSNGIIVPIDTEVSENQLVNIILDLKLDILMIGHDCYDKVKQIIKNKGIEIKLIEINQEEHIEIDSNSDIFSNNTDDDKIKNACLIYYTSGTTGTSKGVMLGNKQLISNCIAEHEALKFPERQCGLNVLPFHHGYAVMCDIIYTFYIGGILCISAGLRHFIKELYDYQPAHLFVVPLIAESLLKIIKGENNINNKVNINDFLKVIACGGAMTRPGLANEYALLGINFIRGYGITECSPIISIMYSDRVYDDLSVGTPISCNKVEIIDEEIYVKGDNVMIGYYNNEVSTKEILKDGWLKTGDLGYINEKGDLYIVGRKKNLIILDNGENIVPEDIEKIIEENDFIIESLVFENRNINQKAHISIIVVIDLTEKNCNAKLQYIIDEFNRRVPLYKHIHKTYARSIPFERTSTKKIKREAVLRKLLFEEISLSINSLINTVNYIKTEVKGDMKFIEDLGMDSVEIMRLVSLIEEKMNINLSNKDIFKLQNVNDLIQFIINKYVIVSNNGITWRHSN